MIEVNLDSVEPGTMVFNSARVPLGIVRVYRQMNGNGPHKEVRHLDNGKWSDRAAYRRSALYRRIQTETAGRVFIRKVSV
jgi:hypothetical protein